MKKTLEQLMAERAGLMMEIQWHNNLCLNDYAEILARINQITVEIEKIEVNR